MALLLEGLRRKKGSWTPEYRLTRLIFEMRMHPTAYHEFKAGFEVAPEKLTDMDTLQLAADVSDWAFLNQVLDMHADVDIRTLKLPTENNHLRGIVAGHNIAMTDLHPDFGAFFVPSWQYIQRKRTTKWKKNLLYIGCFFISSIFGRRYEDKGDKDAANMFCTLGACSMMGCILDLYTGFFYPHSYRNFKSGRNFF